MSTNSALLDLMSLLDTPRSRGLQGAISFRLFVVLDAHRGGQANDVHGGPETARTMPVETDDVLSSKQSVKSASARWSDSTGDVRQLTAS